MGTSKALIPRGSALPLERAAAPVLTGALRLLRAPQARRALAALGALSSATGETRHPLAPAAVRIERSRLRHASGTADQTALTVWFGTGPGLPSPGFSSRQSRSLLRVGGGVLVAAALGAMTVVAAHREALRLDQPSTD